MELGFCPSPREPDSRPSGLHQGRGHLGAPPPTLGLVSAWPPCLPVGLSPEFFLSLPASPVSAPRGVSLSPAHPSLVQPPLVPPLAHCSCFWLGCPFPPSLLYPPSLISAAFSPGLGCDSFLASYFFFFLQPLSTFCSLGFILLRPLALLCLFCLSAGLCLSLFLAFLPINNSPLCSCHL